MKGLYQSFDVVQITTLYFDQNKSYEPLNKSMLTINLDILTLIYLSGRTSKTTQPRKLKFGLN